MDGLWRFALIALLAVVAGASIGVLLGGAQSDPFETVVKTVTGERHTVTKTETETVTSTKTETVTDPGAAAAPLDAEAAARDDDDHDGCSDSYEGACLNPSDGYNILRCKEIPDENFSSIASDPYSLDPDRNGVACESD